MVSVLIIMTQLNADTALPGDCITIDQSFHYFASLKYT